jgi:hypothetical protein
MPPCKRIKLRFRAKSLDRQPSASPMPQKPAGRLSAPLVLRNTTFLTFDHPQHSVRFCQADSTIPFGLSVLPKCGGECGSRRDALRSSDRSSNRDAHPETLPPRKTHLFSFNFWAAERSMSFNSKFFRAFFRFQQSIMVRSVYGGAGRSDLSARNWLRYL